jgi:lipopolysaccharide heptosyltransferase II
MKPKRILVRGVNWLGDAVMTTPALMRLREKYPEAYIALHTPEKLRDLWLNHTAVNETISFSSGEGIFSISKKMRAENFDLALVLPNSPRSALEAWLAGIPQRIGYARQWRNLFLTTHVAPRSGAVKMRKRSLAEINQLNSSSAQNSKLKTQNFSAHQIYDYLHLVAALGANPKLLSPQLLVASDEIDNVRKKFTIGENANPILGINPGAEYGPAKRWPVERFIAAAQEIQKRTNCTWLVFGAQGDIEIAKRFESETRNAKLETRNLAGQTSLRELMALLKHCRVLLTNDSGPMHVAAALGTSVVVPFGSTSPELTGPGLPGDPRHRLIKSDAPCSPCFLRECPIDFRCMNGISVERVVEAVVQTLAQDT